MWGTWRYSLSLVACRRLAVVDIPVWQGVGYWGALPGPRDKVLQQISRRKGHNYMWSCCPWGMWHHQHSTLGTAPSSLGWPLHRLRAECPAWHLDRDIPHTRPPPPQLSCPLILSVHKAPCPELASVPVTISTPSEGHLSTPEISRG